MTRYRYIYLLTLLLAACSTTPTTDAPAPTPQSDNTAEPQSTPQSDSNDSPSATAGDDIQINYTYFGEITAPAFPIGLDWLNVDRPLSIANDLRGKIVLFDFWTLGCINCIHVIPDLKRLETEFADSLIVIGVHSAKFETEGQLESIRQAVLRYGLEHPVVRDTDLAIFYSYGANAWPTSFLIDPLGNAVGKYSGEGVYDALQPVIATMEEEFGANGMIDRRPLELVLESSSMAPTALSFPGKVLADATGNRLFIADSNHNRILVSDLDGELQYAIGSSAEGFDDGDFSSATFYRPQGMALSEDGNTLYIADLENHAVRAADLVNRQVTTIAGNGLQARSYPNGKRGSATELSSPWDLLLAGDQLHIAMSGLHQLWTIDLANDSVNVFVGSGREGINDGDRSDATLAQPSGYATDGELLYFTDPESSAIRSVPLDGSGQVKTIIGTGLFDFGDVDGSYPDALLQHALGIAYYEGKLYVADTYNHKIKIIDPVAQTSETWLGDGQIGWLDGSAANAQLAEPSGLSIANGKLYIADTNNHLVRIADLETGELSTLTLSNLQVARLMQDSAHPIKRIELEAQTVSAGDGTVEFVFNVPENYRFNELGPFTLTWTSDDESVVQFDGTGEPLYQQTDPAFPISFTARLNPGETTLHIEATVFYCVYGEEELCLVRDVALDMPVSVNADGASNRIEVAYLLPEREG